MKFTIGNSADLKFLVDAMLGRLSRFLRIFGYDTVYANDLEDLFNMDPVQDDYLLKFAEENNRIIITKDYPFYKKAKNRIIFLEGEGIYNYLNQLKVKLNLLFEFDLSKARCSVCNFPLRKINNKKIIKNMILKETYRNYDTFYQCTSPKCKKIYWKGSHIMDIVKKLKKKLN